MDEFENFYGRKTRDDELDAKQDDQNIKGLEADPKSNSFYSFGASHVHRRELKRETWIWKSRDLEEREFCIPISLKDLEGYSDKIVTKVN